MSVTGKIWVVKYQFWYNCYLRYSLTSSLLHLFYWRIKRKCHHYYSTFQVFNGSLISGVSKKSILCFVIEKKKLHRIKCTDLMHITDEFLPVDAPTQSSSQIRHKTFLSAMKFPSCFLPIIFLSYYLTSCFTVQQNFSRYEKPSFFLMPECCEF